MNEVRRQLEEQAGKKFDDDTKLFHDYGHQDALICAMLKQVNRVFDKKVQSHDFRTSRATEMYIRTGDILAVQEFLCHSKVTTTQRYIHPLGKTKRRELEAKEKGAAYVSFSVLA